MLLGVYLIIKYRNFTAPQIQKMKTNLPSRTPLGKSFNAQFLLLLLLLSSVGVFGQSIFTNPITGTNPNISDPYTIGQTVNTNIIVTGIGRGSGITGINTNDRYNASGWDSASFDANDYFIFNITPNATHNINFVSFVYTGQKSGTGPTSFALRSSLDGYNSNIGTATATGNTITLSGINYQNISSAITFRIYGWGASAIGGTFSINDFTFNGTVVAAGKTSVAGSGNWNAAGTWSPSGVPIDTDIVTIPLGSTVYNDVAGLVRKSATNVNGSFQLQQGSYVDSSSGTVDFTYGSAGTLLFNNSSGSYGVNAGDKYWPTADAPFNVTVMNTGGVTMNTARTVIGIMNVGAPLTNPGNITIGTTGTNSILQLNAGYTFLGIGSPTYGNASLLKYNSGDSPGRSVEWNQTAGTIGITAGYPNNVQVSNNTTLNFATGGTATYKADKTVVIDAGSSLYQNYGGGNAGLAVGTDLTVNGNLTLGTTSGDLYVGGNFTVGASGNFNPFGRAAVFNGAANQSITRTGAGVIGFDYITVDKSGGNLVLSGGPATDISLNATSTDFLRLINTGGLDLNGRTLELNNPGGGIYVNGARTITSSIAGGKIDVNQYKYVSNNLGTGTLDLASNVIVNLNTNGNLDFGKSSGVTITTLNGTLSINSLTSCYVNTNPPIYGAASLLRYNSSGTYGRGVEWCTTSGAGFPNDVQVSNNTTLDIPNTGSAFSTNLALSRDLTVDSGSSLYMDYGGGAASGALTVGRNVNISGNLSLGDTAPGDMFVAGNWSRTGTFSPNGRLVTFNGAAAQTLTGATTFDYLTLNNATGLTLSTANTVIVNQTLGLTNGKLTLGANDLTVGGTITGASSTNYVVTNGTGQLKRTVAATSVQFPIGPTDTKYNPISATNTGTSDVYGFRVATGVTGAADINYMVNNSWFVSEANVGGSNLKVVPTWNVSDEGGSFSASDNIIELYPATITTYDATVTGQTAVLTNSGDNFSTSFDGSQFFVVGKRRPSKVSDIIIDPSFAYTSNINYTPFVNSNITALNSVELANFIIRDGGGTLDSDSFATVLNSIGFTVVNVANLDRLAIYDGTTEIAEVAAAATTNFTGLTLTAPDNSTKTFTIRGSFKTAVTDNQQIQLTVASAIANAATSTFATTNAGGAFSSITGDRNRIEVTADRLAFVQQPNNTNVNASMTPAVTVAANDINGNRDLDFSDVVQITSTGTLNATPANATAASGLASFNSILHTAQGTGLSLNASFTGLTSATSTTFNITLVSAATDRFRTRASGNWSTASTWESSNDGTTWVIPSTLAPTSSAFSIEILSTHTVTTSASATAKNLTVKTGSTLILDNQITNNGTFKIENGGTVIINYTVADLSTNIWNGDEDFAPESIIKFKLLNSSANLFKFSAGVPVVTPRTYEGYTALFGQLILEAANGWSSFLPTDANYNLTHKDLSINYTAISNGSFFGGSSITMGIGRDFIINTGQNTPDAITYQTGAGNSVLYVRRNFIKNGTGTGEFRFSSHTTSSANNITFNIDGDLIVNNGVVNMIQGVSGGSVFTLNLKGNLNVLAGRLYNSNTSSFASCAFYFNGGSEQTINYVPSSSFSHIPIYIKSGSNVKLINQDFALGTNSKIIVENGGTFNFGLNPLHVITNTSQVGMTFNAMSGSTLKITSPDGITTTAAGPNSGNVQTPVSGRTFNKGAIYHYIGKTNQATGNAIPDQITGKLIVELDTQNITQDDIQFTSSGTTTFGTISGVNGVLEIRNGKVIDQPNFGFRNYNGALDDGETDVQRGDIIMSGGRYVVSGAGTKPALSGMYTISAGTVEFAGTAATKIRTSISPVKQYFNIDIFGTNVETGGKSLFVNNLLKVTDASAVFIGTEQLDDSATPYVVTARKGIKVLAGKAIFKNNSTLIQDIDAVNSGNIIMERKTNVPSIQYNYWSSPVKDQALYSLYPNIPDNTVMTYNSLNDKFIILPRGTNPTSTFGKGYSIKGPSSMSPAVTAMFIGEPNNETTAGIKTIALSTLGNNYNLIGNPYPSNLNVLSLYGDADNTTKFYNDVDETPTAYFWDNTSNGDTTQQGSGYTNLNYAQLNLSTGIGTSAPRFGTTGKKPNGIIKPGQGFIMRAAETGGQLTFKNVFRTKEVKPSGGTDGVYYKGSAAETIDKFWLNLTTPNSVIINIALAYNEEAEDTFERFDSKILSEGVTENFYSLSSDNAKLAIQSRKGSYSIEDRIPLGIKTSATGLQKISIDEKYGVFENQAIFLKDNLLNIQTNLSEEPYIFTSNLGMDQTRFEIVFKPKSILITGENVKDYLQVYRSGEYFVVKSNNSKINGVEVYDAAGRLYEKVNGGSAEVKIDATSLANGLYIFKISRNNDVTSKKILK